MVRIVGYSASQQVYASGVVRFLTSAGKQIEMFSNSFLSKKGHFVRFHKAKQKQWQ